MHRLQNSRRNSRAPARLSITDAPEQAAYIGRFAPTPSGQLHLGSLVAALGSYLAARHHAGRWYLRIDDIDPPRVKPGSADNILRTLDNFGLQWDGQVTYQSARAAQYADAVHQLVTNKRAFPCACSRNDIKAVAQIGPDGPIYPGTCRNGIAPGKAARAIRLRVSSSATTFQDQILGAQEQALNMLCGDFVIRRADGPYAYQLACVVDDLALGVTNVVRGADLLSSTGRQIYVYQCLGHSAPQYAHVPTITDLAGKKLSKSDAADPIHKLSMADTLNLALSYLGQSKVDSSNVEEILTSATQNWHLDTVPKTNMSSPPGNR